MSWKPRRTIMFDQLSFQGEFCCNILYSRWKRSFIVPRESTLPLSAGYAECVNSGKSHFNEDQAAFSVQLLHHSSKDFPDLPYVYFGIFDGHAGFGASLAASHQFHHILHEKLVDIIELLLPANIVVVIFIESDSLTLISRNLRKHLFSRSFFTRKSGKTNW